MSKILGIVNTMEKAKQTCLEMLTQRMYLQIEEEDDRFTATKPDGEQMCAFLTNAPKFNNDRAHEYISLMNELGISHSIIVYIDSVTSSAKKIEQNLENMQIELFSADELQYNITRHSLQPTFDRLSEPEAVAFRKTYGLKFPTILKSDPIARFYNYQKGDVIKITRKNGYVTYRIVRG